MLAQPALAAPQQPAGRGAELDSDALLQASRRLDWRFLLPDPSLGQVAYVGPARGALLDSLRLFSAVLTMIDRSDTQAERAAQYDLVVARGPAPDALWRAADLVRPGGFLYVEVANRLWPRRRGAGGPRYAADYVAALGSHGFDEVAAYWHWPNFESCAEIVPLDDRDALLLAFSRRRSGTVARLKTTAGRWLLRSGLLARVVPCFSVLAHRLY